MSSSPNLTLHDWSCLRTELRWIYDHAPQEKSRHLVTDHRTGNWAWYLRKGEVRIETSRGPVIAKAGQWLLLPGERHRQDFSDDASLISINFLCQWPTGENIIHHPEAVVIQGKNHPRLEKTAVRLARLVKRHFPVPHHIYARQSADYPLFLQFQRSLFDWLEAWFQARIATGSMAARHTGDERVVRAARVLDEAPLQGGFPAASLPASAGVGIVQLNRLFRLQLKLTPLQYWERRRLELARLCLEASEIPLKELAANLGFRSDSHFAAWFKRHIHTSPGRYRDQNSRAVPGT
ncbi:MAG: helix-turn-helix domain-containing protein [Opitutaceae bacterium]|jgi:AraC-like DNA-binding protein